MSSTVSNNLYLGNNISFGVSIVSLHASGKLQQKFACVITTVSLIIAHAHVYPLELPATLILNCFSALGNKPTITVKSLFENLIAFFQPNLQMERC